MGGMTLGREPPFKAWWAEPWAESHHESCPDK